MNRNKYNPPWNKGKVGIYKHSQETKKKISENTKKAMSNFEIKRKHKEKCKGTKYWLGKNLSEETKRKISKTNKGKIPWNKNKKNIYSKETLLKMSKGNKDKHHSEKTKKKLSEILKGNKYALGYKHTIETKKKLREIAINHIKKYNNNCMPMLGKYEKQILDIVEFWIYDKIERQYYCDGYFIDGYWKKGNIVFEVDEKYHNNNYTTIKDKIRENNIKNKLNCLFIRIPSN